MNSSAVTDIPTTALPLRIVMACVQRLIAGGVLSLALLVLAATPAFAAQGDVVETFPAPVSDPTGLAFDWFSGGAVWSFHANRPNPGIYILDLAPPHGAVSFPYTKLGDPDFTGGAIDPVTGNVYAADFNGDRNAIDDHIYLFDRSGATIAFWETDGGLAGVPCTGGTVDMICDVALDPAVPGRVYATTCGINYGSPSKLIHVLDLSDTSGGASTPSPCSILGSFEVPDPIVDVAGIEYSPCRDGYWLSDFGSAAIMLVDNDGTFGTVLEGFTLDTGSGRYPGIAAPCNGEIWVADTYDDAISRVDATDLDHFLCYKSKDKLQLSVTLIDEFEAGTHYVNGTRRFCAPADKNGEGVDDRDTHLQAYAVKGPHTKRSSILVKNQFGEILVDTKKADLLMVPTAKSLAPAPRPTTDPLPDVDHFRCLKAVYGKALKTRTKFPKGILATVEDQFGSRSVELKRPSKLCNPTDKNGSGILDPDNHLLCYKVKVDPKTTKIEGVQVANQFGDGLLELKKESELCVPSSMSAACGDGTLDPPAEQCDGADLGGETCESLGFSGGSPSCDPLLCQIDTSPCSVCGNATTEPGEDCDGVDDAACPGRCSEQCECFSALEDLTTCDPERNDDWTFDVTAGQAVHLRVDTADAATTSDLYLEGDCEGVDSFSGDDDFDCAYPFVGCPQASFTATVSGTCTFTIGAYSCNDAATANYVLYVRIDDAPVAAVLVKDDVEPCPGTLVGGACWYLSAPGESCDTACAAAGLTYDSATRTYAGSDGTLARCDAVLTALGEPAPPTARDAPCDSLGLGCAVIPSIPDRIRCTTPPTTSADSGALAQRACACQ